MPDCCVTSDGGVRNFHVSGKIEASTEPQDMRLQRMWAHVGAAQPEAPVGVGGGCGAGVTPARSCCTRRRAHVIARSSADPQVVAQYSAGNSTWCTIVAFRWCTTTPALSPRAGKIRRFTSEPDSSGGQRGRTVHEDTELSREPVESGRRRHAVGWPCTRAV